MREIIYELPISSTAFIKSPEFQIRPGRNCILICEYEDEENDTEIKMNLIFDKVEALKITYYKAVNTKMIQNAYDKIINCGATEWLEEVKSNLVMNELSTNNLSHLAVYFDDATLYEFICKEFSVEKQ